MHPPLHYHLGQARTAGPDHHARRDTLTHAARQARRARRHPPGLSVSRADTPPNNGGHLPQDRLACQRGRSS
jgi:hypothetical protein